jgi:hypothetical protein
MNDEWRMKNRAPDLGQDGRERQSKVQSSIEGGRFARAGGHILVRVSSGRGIGRNQAHLFCHPQRDNHPV